MIHLRHDCLAFKEADGSLAPMSVHEVTLKLAAATSAQVDQELIEHAASAVLHFFKVEKGQTSVTVSEFSEALERVLRDLGLEVEACESSFSVTVADASGPLSGPRVVDTDLQALAEQESHGCELLFFPRLREAVRSGLDGTPLVLRFRGLRACVKKLAGTRRWNASCQSLNDRIIDYIRTCLTAEHLHHGCVLLIR